MCPQEQEPRGGREQGIRPFEIVTKYLHCLHFVMATGTMLFIAPYLYRRPFQKLVNVVEAPGSPNPIADRIVYHILRIRLHWKERSFNGRTGYG